MDNGINQGNFRSIFNIKNLPRYISAITKVNYDVDDITGQNRLSTPSGKKLHNADDEYSYLYDSIPEEYSNIPYFSRNYQDRKRDLLAFASHPEIEFIVHSIAYDAIVYDENNFFLSPSFDTTIKEDVKKQIGNRFKEIYQSLGFNDGQFAWEKFVEFINVGYLSLEIVYDNPYNPKEIAGFEEMEPETLIPFYKDIEILQNGVTSRRKVKLWKQIIKKGGQNVERILPDNSVIFLQYNKVQGNTGRYSYTERLIRSFNLKRTMENCKAAWQIMNSQFRLKITLPVGTRNSDKAKQALAAVNNKFKEEVTIDSLSGEVYVNGQPMISYGKTITLPSRSGSTPDIGSLAIEGPNMENLDIVKHFEKSLWRDSSMPFARFDKDNGGGTTVVFSEDGITNDDRFYFNFFSTIRKEFCEQLIKKPLILQANMDYPQLIKDQLFRAKLGFTYNSDSQYTQAKEEQIENHKIERINKWMEFQKPGADGGALFNLKYFVVNKYNLLTEEEWTAATATDAPKLPDEGGGGEITNDAPPSGGGTDTPVTEPGTDEFTPL